LHNTQFSLDFSLDFTNFTMAGSRMCPCASCFGSTPQYTPVQHHQEQQQRLEQQQAHPQPSFLKAKKNDSMFNKLRRVHSTESTTSTLVGLTTDMQPMGISDKE